jgi:hypothetical protein
MDDGALQVLAGIVWGPDFVSRRIDVSARPTGAHPKSFKPKLTTTVLSLHLTMEVSTRLYRFFGITSRHVVERISPGMHVRSTKPAPSTVSEVDAAREFHENFSFYLRDVVYQYA